MAGFEAVSLFSNCGAGDVGFARAGFRFRVLAEIDERRLDVALRNHPDASGVVGDLREDMASGGRVVPAALRLGTARPAVGVPPVPGHELGAEQPRP